MEDHKMKRNLQITVLMAVFALIFNSNSNSQELLVGGNMENDTLWESSQLDSQVETTVTYNYKTDTTKYGSGGCAHFTATTESDTDHKYAQYCIYQKVRMVVGKTYTVKGAYKAINVGNFWCEVRISDLKPEDGSDYKPYGEDPFINLSTWEELKTGDDTIFNKDYTVPETFGSPGDTVDMYFVIKMGVWDYTITYEFLLDEISLASEETTGIRGQEKVQGINVYPNPTDNLLNISLTPWRQDAIVEIFNMSGQKVMEQHLKSRVIDVSRLSKGTYTIIIKDDNNKYSSKFIKK